MNLKILLSFLIASQFIFCQVKPKNEISILNKTEFKISYSSDLKLDESGKNGMTFILLTERTNSEDNFSENINLMKQDLEKLNLNLDKYVEITEKQVTEKGKLIESKRLKRNGTEYQRLVYEAFLNNFDLKFLQYDFIKNNKAYILTFTAKKEEFEKYLKNMEEIMKSFKLK
ncbi:hypothetical protein RRM46_002371 [Flavobacterium psychrophilum]|nr:hypothetical protein [Flavobacterium psychrophilum]